MSVAALFLAFAVMGLDAALGARSADAIVGLWLGDGLGSTLLALGSFAVGFATGWGLAHAWARSRRGSIEALGYAE